MQVVWKRPDGFHGADPSDYVVVEVGRQSKLWLHRKDHSWFPFRIAGGWQEQEATKRLNNLINLLPSDDASWTSQLIKIFNDQMGDDAGKFIDDLSQWLANLHAHLKGDTWETEIMNQVISEVESRVRANRANFLSAARQE